MESLNMYLWYYLIFVAEVESRNLKLEEAFELA